MSALALRCPNCGTAQARAGECEACHEAAVRYFCANHTPGRWLDAPACDACGARVGFDPVPAPVPAPVPTPRSAPPRRAPPTARPLPPPADAPPTPVPVRRRRRAVTLDDLLAGARRRVPPRAPAPAPWGDSYDAPADDTLRAPPPLRVPTLRVPGVLGCLGRLVVALVLLALAALGGAFVWVTQF